MPVKKRSATKGQAVVEAPKSVGSTPVVHPRIAFIKSLKLLGIGIDHCEASIDRDLLAEAKAEKLELETDLAVDYSVITHEQDSFVIGASFRLSQKSKSSAKEIVLISTTFSAKFGLSQPANEELVKAFAHLEAKLIFFPYLRHFVSDMSYRMAIDVILLPMTSELEK